MATIAPPFCFYLFLPIILQTSSNPSFAFSLSSIVKPSPTFMSILLHSLRILHTAMTVLQPPLPQLIFYRLSFLSSQQIRYINTPIHHYRSTLHPGGNHTSVCAGSVNAPIDVN